MSLAGVCLIWTETPKTGHIGHVISWCVSYLDRDPKDRSYRTCHKRFTSPKTGHIGHFISCGVSYLLCVLSGQRPQSQVKQDMSLAGVCLIWTETPKTCHIGHVISWCVSYLDRDPKDRSYRTCHYLECVLSGQRPQRQVI